LGFLPLKRIFVTPLLFQHTFLFMRIEIPYSGSVIVKAKTPPERGDKIILMV